MRVRNSRLASAIGLALALGCAPEPVDTRPSVLLVVVDTLRADAVSAYGRVRGTTPNFDSLAQDGLRFEHAFAPSPWTLPSHASILTGLAIDRHGVGIGGRMGLPDRIETVAERLRAAGYQTAGFSENPLVSDGFGMDQGFERFRSVTVEEAMAEATEPGSIRFDALAEIRRFAAERDTSRPFFVFVNLFDPHSPYEDREADRFVPPKLVDRKTWTPRRLARSPYAICSRLPEKDDLAILHGLYLGDVAEVDRKLGEIEASFRQGPDRPLIVVVTADHGEQFGEHQLLDHEFTVRGQALRVPLLVHGLAGVVPARIDSPVELPDIAPSILDWAGVGPVDGLSGRSLPTENKGRPAADLFAVYSDEKLRVPDDWGADSDVQSDVPDQKRAGCVETDRVFGNMAALTHWPFKLIWFQNHPPELYDLSWDPEERSDLAALRPEVTAELLGRARVRIEAVGLDGQRSPAESGVTNDEIEALEALGYLD